MLSFVSRRGSKWQQSGFKSSCQLPRFLSIGFTLAVPPWRYRMQKKQRQPSVVSQDVAATRLWATLANHVILMKQCDSHLEAFSWIFNLRLKRDSISTHRDFSAPSLQNTSVTDFSGAGFHGLHSPPLASGKFSAPAPGIAQDSSS